MERKTILKTLIYFYETPAEILFVFCLLGPIHIYLQRSHYVVTFLLALELMITSSFVFLTLSVGTGAYRFFFLVLIVCTACLGVTLLAYIARTLRKSKNYKL